MLPTPRTAVGVAGLAAIVADPSGAVLAFDFDGTLAPIVPYPPDARPQPGAVEALARLARHVGTVAIITGRPAEVAVDLGGFAAAAGLEGLVVLGHYGRERWENGTLSAPPVPASVEAARQELPEVIAAAPAGTSVEDKHSSLAVHVRRTADPDAAMVALEPPLRALADRLGLRLEPGRLVLELRASDADKGGALRDLVRERQARTVLFAGDDLGDLAAFDAVDELRAEGRSAVTVCSGSAEVGELAARADVVVDGPGGVVALLDALVQVLDARRLPDRP
jgi:trehalose 6-phosphate phosphatase